MRVGHLFSARISQCRPGSGLYFLVKVIFIYSCRGSQKKTQCIKMSQGRWPLGLAILGFCSGSWSNQRLNSCQAFGENGGRPWWAISYSLSLSQEKLNLPNTPALSTQLRNPKWVYEKCVQKFSSFTFFLHPTPLH